MLSLCLRSCCGPRQSDTWLDVGYGLSVLGCGGVSFYPGRAFCCCRIALLGFLRVVVAQRSSPLVWDQGGCRYRGARF